MKEKFKNCWTCIYKSMREGAPENVLQCDIDLNKFVRVKDHIDKCGSELSDQEKFEKEMLRTKISKRRSRNKNKRKADELGKTAGDVMRHMKHQKIEVDKW